MSKTIEIKIDTTDDAMIGSGSWESADPRASVLRFLDLVRAEITRCWPGYGITIEETEYKNEVVISDGREYGAEIEDDQGAIREAISDVWNRGDWYAEA